jgi:hypothetical protein
MMITDFEASNGKAAPAQKLKCTPVLEKIWKQEDVVSRDFMHVPHWISGYPGREDHESTATHRPIFKAITEYQGIKTN